MDTNTSIVLNKKEQLHSDIATISKNKETTVVGTPSIETMQAPSKSELGIAVLDTIPKRLNTEHVTKDTAVHAEKKPRVNELDKFKRRLIRAIARLMLVEKKPEEEIWKELKKETTCDCKLLWTRMRALTIKKLKRLIVANDRNECITKIAQLSVTDWLLYDLVLVHEDVDVIGEDIQRDDDNEPKILEDLYQLVLKYKIELLSGDRLTLAWYELTSEYNSLGRKCSPMLLQRRWYQLKKLVRHKFYSFWFEYRGSMKNFQQADKYKPTDLEMEIVKSFMYIVTDPFKSWEQLIDEKNVSLTSDFERLQLSKRRNVHTENEPDILVIEPHVETIDLGVESDKDSNDSTQNENDNKDLDNVDSINADSDDANDSATIIKTELVQDVFDEDDVSVLESVHIPLESNVHLAISSINEDLKASDSKETNIVHDENQDSNENTDSPVATDVNEVQEITDVGSEQNDDDVGLETVEQDVDISEQIDTYNIQAVDQNDFDIVMPKITSTAQIPEIDISDETPEINNILESVTNTVSQTKLYNTKSEKNTNEPVVDTESLCVSEDKKEIVIKRKIEDSSDFFDELPNDLHFIDGIELEDDGIEFIDEEEHIPETKIAIKVETNEPTIAEDDDTPKIDLKLLLNPVVYTKKLDHMDVFRFIDYITVKDRRVIDNAVFESKPVDKKSVKMEEIAKECESSSDDDTLSDKASECSSEKEEEQEIIKSTSWLFRKPRVSSYNPIQLCKNPDFNTRLKRLTVGFLSSQRNRQLLQHCKPLTIDVHKAFETKLVNNSLCLRKSYFSEAKQTESKTVEKTVLPSALPGQSLSCNTQDSILSTSIPSTSKINLITRDELAPEVCITERNKVINLPDLDQIRRKNEKLLVAEVTPLQASNVTNIPPVAILQEKKVVEQNIQQVKDIEIEQVPKDLNDTNTRITVVDTPEVINIGKTNKNNSEAITIPSDVNNETLSYYQRTRVMKKFTNKSVKNKVRKIAVTWNPRNLPAIENHKPDDRLLAPDTVERIISVCKGINAPITSKKSLTIFNRKRHTGKALTKQAKVSCGELQKANEEKVDETPKEQQHQQKTIQCETINRDQGTEVKDTVNMNNVGQTQKKGGRNKRKSRKALSCCWAREKLEFWSGNIKRVRIRHKCPQYKCVCCCNFEYCYELKRRRDNKSSVVSYLNLVSDDDSDPNSGNLSEGQKSSQIQKDDKNPYSIKVSVGINTDFDKEFEESYAANVNKFNNSTDVRNQPVISCVTSLCNEVSYSNATQTFSCQPVEFGPQEITDSLTDITSNKEIVGPFKLIATPSLIETERKEHKLINIRPKCKTKIYPSYTSSLDQNVLNTKKLELPNSNIVENFSSGNVLNNKILILNNNSKTNKNKSRSQKPICLGKNKILLCSLKPLSKTTMIDVTHLVNNFNPNIVKACANKEPSTLIPKGVHLVLLPNQELVLSIDPGVDLDPKQITHLPAIINSVQQQLFNSGIINKLPNTDGIISNRKVGDVIQLSDDESEKNNDTKINSNVSLRDLEQEISFNTINKTNADSVKHTSFPNEIPSETSVVPQSTSQLVDNNENTTRSDEVIPDSQIDPTSQEVEQKDSLPNNSSIDEQKDGPPNNSSINEQKDVLSNNSSIDEQEDALPNNCFIDKQKDGLPNNSSIDDKKDGLPNNSSVDEQKDGLPNNSFIDEQKDGFPNNSSVNEQKDALPNNSSIDEGIDNASDIINKDIFKDTVNTSKKTILSDLMEMSGISLEDTAIINTENPIIEPPSLQPVVFPQELNTQLNVLPSSSDINSFDPLVNNAFVQAALLKCPELNVVYSFEDLKYAYENNGQFYKMDTVTGIIVPINVCIKKQSQLKSNIKNLSKSVIDLTKEDNVDNNSSIEETEPEEKNVENDTSPINVKPIKLFKAIHPSILRHNFKTLLKQQKRDKILTVPKLQVKKLIKIIKGRRKQDIKNTKLNINKRKSPKCVEKEKSASDSESDDEPLALKAKRIRRTSEGTSSNIENNESQTENNQETEEVQLSQQVMEVDRPVSPDVPMLPEDQPEPVFEPSLEAPVIFQCNNDESSEEDCILGV